jgi:hypothetical protein
MLFKSQIVTQASGSIGGLTATRSRSGMVFRARTIPVNPSSFDQTSVRQTFGNLSAAWSVLTAPQRTAWETYASNVSVINKLGDPIFLTGQQRFVRCNAVRLRAGLTQVSDGPTTMVGATLGPITASVQTGTGQISVTFTEADPWVDEDDAGVNVFISHDKGVGVTYHRGPYRFAGQIAGDSVSAPTSPDTSLTSPFAHTVGNVVFFRFIAMRADARITQSARLGPVGVTA